MTKKEMEISCNFEFYKEGWEAGFNFFYNLYAPSLLRFGEKHFRNMCAVEEILNDAFLSTWELRDMIECPRHLYCFIRLRLKWGCIKYYQKRKRAGMVSIENMDNSFAADPAHFYNYRDNEELVKIIYKAIALLPPTRANIMKLYFNYGFSCKQIAGHYQSSCQHISAQLHASLEYLKTVVRKKKQVSGFRIISAKRLSDLATASDERLQAEQLQLFKMRYEEKCSFETIASRLGMDISEVQRKYIEAHRMLRTFKTQKRYWHG